MNLPWAILFAAPRSGQWQNSTLAVATAAALRERVKGSPTRLDSTDPLLYGGIMLFLAAAALGAMLGPARRGAQSDPLDALRCE